MLRLLATGQFFSWPTMVATIGCCGVCTQHLKVVGGGGK